jgi:hypothetical protein
MMRRCDREKKVGRRPKAVQRVEAEFAPSRRVTSNERRFPNMSCFTFLKAEVRLAEIVQEGECGEPCDPNLRK